MTQHHADKALHDMDGDKAYTKADVAAEVQRRVYHHSTLYDSSVFQLDVLEARFRQAKEHGWKTDWLRVHELAESILSIASDYPPTQAELEALENAA